MTVAPSPEYRYSLDPAPAIFTFGGDRETFDFDDPENYLRIDDDIWKLSLPGCTLICFAIPDVIISHILQNLD